MSLSLIVAMNHDRIIGSNNRLPWHLPEDLKHFKNITTGHAIIMGRKTYESIGRPLPNRDNIILTRQENLNGKGIKATHSLQSALDEAYKTDSHPIVIGGSQIYKIVLPIVDKMYITLVDLKVEGDTLFPLFNWEDWKIKEIGKIDHAKFLELIKR